MDRAGVGKGRHGEPLPWSDASFLSGVGLWAIFASVVVALSARVGVPYQPSYYGAVLLALLASGALTAAVGSGLLRYRRPLTALVFILGVFVWPAASAFAEASRAVNRVDVVGYLLLLMCVGWAALLGLGVLAAPLRLWDAWRRRRGQPTMDQLVEGFLTRTPWRAWVLLLIVSGILGILLPELLRAFVHPLVPGFRVPSPIGEVLFDLGVAVLAAGLLYPVHRRMQSEGSTHRRER